MKFELEIETNEKITEEDKAEFLDRLVILASDYFDLKQNPCRYCTLFYDQKRKLSPTYEEMFYKGENRKQHEEYLKPQRLFEVGEQITSMAELMEQRYVFVSIGARIPRHIEVIRNWQYRIIENSINGGSLYKAIRKDPIKAESEE